MDKHKTIISFFVIIIFTIFIIGCSIEKSSSLTKTIIFDVNTGEKIKITLNMRNGGKYDMSSSTPILLTNNKIKIGEIEFLSYEGYNRLDNISKENVEFTILEEEENNEVFFSFYKFENNDVVEFVYLALINNSITGVVIYFENNIPQESAKELINNLTFEKII